MELKQTPSPYLFTSGIDVFIWRGTQIDTWGLQCWSKYQNTEFRFFFKQKSIFSIFSSSALILPKRTICLRSWSTFVRLIGGNQQSITLSTNSDELQRIETR